MFEETKDNKKIKEDRYNKLNERQKKKFNDMPNSYQNNYLKALNGSKKCAIKALCLECVMWQKDEVKLCPSVSCPLYYHRPYVKKI